MEYFRYMCDEEKDQILLSRKIIVFWLTILPTVLVVILQLLVNNSFNLGKFRFNEAIDLLPYSLVMWIFIFVLWFFWLSYKIDKYNMMEKSYFEKIKKINEIENIK